MNWYYAGNDGNRVGPLSDEAFENAVREGNVTPETLVWNKGMPDWQPFSEVGPPAAGGAGNTTPAAAIPGGAPVTPENKDDVAQMIKEGIEPTEAGVQWEYAGFWIRFMAEFIDWMLMFVINMVIQFGILAIAFTVPPESPLIIISSIVGSLVQFAINLSYFVYFHGNPKHQATIGKKALKLRIITAEGEDVSYLRAFGRYWASVLSALVFLIGYIMAAFDDEKRAMHDHICSTRVIKV